MAKTKIQPKGWKETTLGEIPNDWNLTTAEKFCEKVADGTHDSPKQKEQGKHLVTSKHIKNGKVDLKTAYRISEKDFVNINKRSGVNKWDVLLSMIGTVGEVCLVDEEPDFAIKNVGLFKCGSEKKAKWLYYFLRSKIGQNEIHKRLSGTTQSYITLGSLRSFPVTIPSSVNEQDEITSVLSSLDDKIELLRKQSETLEQIARTIFHEWFVAFNFPNEQGKPYKASGGKMVASELGEIPEGWRVGKLEEIGEVIDCLHSKKPERVFENTGRVLLQLENIKDSGLLDLTEKFFISEEDYLFWISRTEASEGDCVITNVGRVGVVSRIPKGVRAALGRNMTAVRVKTHFNYPYFLIGYLTSNLYRNELSEKTDVGTILDALNVRNISKLRLIITNNHLLVENGNSFLSAFWQKMEANVLQMSQLSRIRDSLLPKLMSGGVRVNIKK